MGTTDDLGLVAERLRVVRAANEISNEAYSAAVEAVYGRGDNFGTLLHDESLAIDAWLDGKMPPVSM